MRFINLNHINLFCELQTRNSKLYIMHLFVVCFLGWLLSFLGQLPLGTISLTATQIAVQENFKNAWKYSFGVALAEMIYLRLVLAGVNWFMDHKLFFSVLLWSTCILFFLLGVFCLVNAGKQKEDKKGFLLDHNFSRFWLGLTISALNPVQIPFWFVWTSYFATAGLLDVKFNESNLFTIGAGLGTICGLMVYSYGGNLLITKMKTSNRRLNKIVGIIFIIAALAQLIKLFQSSKL